MPLAIVPVNKNRPRIHVVWGINTIVRTGDALPSSDGATTETTQQADSTTTEQMQTYSMDDTESSRGGTVVYDTAFDLNDVACQEHLMNMCRSIALRNDLVQPKSELCIFDSFAIWLKKIYQLDFPINPISTVATDTQQSIAYLLYRWTVTDTIGKRFKSYVIYDSIPTGLEGDPSKVLVIVSMFYSIERSYEGGFQAMTSYAKWDKLLSFVNEDAPKSTGGAAFHTSDLWTRAITEVVAVLGTLSGIGFVLVTTFLALWLFTASARAAAICTSVLLCVLSITTGLFWLYGWELGIIEAVGVSILLGACVDYPAHVIERFVEIDDDDDDDDDEASGGASLFVARRRRIKRSMTSVGVSVLNASATTVVSCGTLIFCTVQVFTRVGVIMLTASAVSMAATLFMVPAVLSLCGPTLFERTIQYRLKVLVAVVCIGATAFLIVYGINVSLGRPLF